MKLKEFIDSLTAEQKAYFVDYIQECEQRAYNEGKKHGRTNGLYEARNKLTEEFGL